MKCKRNKYKIQKGGKKETQSENIYITQRKKYE